MTVETKSSEVVFFLGAGASVAAGVPDTFSFVGEYINSIEENDKKDAIKKIVETLEKWKGTKIDVELLLETLTKLKNKEQEPLLQFYNSADFILRGYYEKGPLVDDLKDFIKSKAIVSEEKIQYLQSLLGLVEEFRPLDVISVNYDTCIEQFCNAHKLAYQDGFDVHWNPKTFETEHTDIRLYKLHGSVMWYQSDRGGYIKLPVMTEESKIQLITGEKAENLMLYPMQKWDYAEPLLELLVGIKRLLESETCKFLIVVGYSFRDEHIRRILWDAARKNRELHLILIGPKAYQIYFEKLKYYDNEHKIPSSLEGKVVCLPYLFEKVSPYLKNHYLGNLKSGLHNETNVHKNEIQGQKPDWIYCIKLFANAEYTEKVENLLKRTDISELERDYSLNLEIPLKMIVSLSSNNQEQEANKYLKIFINALYIMMVQRINVNVRGDSFIEFSFNYRRHDSGSSLNKIGDFKKVTESLFEFCKTRENFVKSVGNNFQKASGKVSKIKNYLDPFKEEGIAIKNYILLREGKIPDIDSFIGESQSTPLSDEFKNKFASTITEVEKSILEEIIKDE